MDISVKRTPRVGPKGVHCTLKHLFRFLSYYFIVCFMTLFYSITWCILTMHCFRSQGPVNEIVSAKEKKFFVVTAW